MNAEEQLAYESRVRFRQGAIAAVAGVLIVAAAIIQITGIHTKVDELTIDLIVEHQRFPLDLIGSIINSIGLLALAATLNYLYEISRARNEEIQTWIRWLAVFGATLSALAAIAYAATIASKASEFVSHGTQTYQQANALTSGGLIVVLPLVAQLASLLLTAGFIWISLNAMRVGLLTRFMGYLGIFAGVLVLFPIGSPVPVVQGFWLVAVAVMLIGRWPTGQPKAWSSGVAEPWPSNAEMRAREQMAPEARAKRLADRKAQSETKAAAKTDVRARWNALLRPKSAGFVESTAKDVAPDADDDESTPTHTGTPSPSTSAAKRKRKRRK